MKHLFPQDSTTRCVAITVRGVVQGVGFRPFVYNAACMHGLAGWVQNEAGTVRIEVAGQRLAVAAFLDTLRNQSPPQARIDTIEVDERTPSSLADADPAAAVFQIRASAGGAAPQPTIPADLATCEACLAEIRNPAQRRYRYPFTNCTNCGPRWSIIRELPYDRPRTSMAEFAMCDDCRAEYREPADRRFHAQPIACPRCGPTLQLLDAEGRPTAADTAALAAAVQSLLAGQIVAVKGLGGFQLLVDATNADAVVRLRQRKHRPDRPLAVMFRSLADIRQCCEVSEEEALAIGSHEAPILLLRRKVVPLGEGNLAGDRSRSWAVAAAVAPDNPYLGAMLPCTPLHHLLMADAARPLVCTSGNVSEEPMVIHTEDALRRLAGVADVWLTHNRPIVRPVDDSVARIGPEGLQVLRRARGYAPLPISLQSAAPTILAVGGHLKNTVALALGRAVGPAPVVLGPHVGDLDHLLSIEVFRKAIEDLVAFFEVTPEMVACDLHPDYASTRHAEALTARWNVPLVRVQHHHAHVAACMAEHGLEGPVLGLAWDGTGYGADGTVWGGEALVCEGSDFRRVAHLRTFALPGGDRAARQPRRSALGLLFEIFGERAADHVADWFNPSELKTLLQLLARGLHTPRTSSMGRLFDAVAALCGLSRAVSFEGQAAMALEFAADPAVGDAYPLPLVVQPAALEPAAVADWEPLVRAVLADRRAAVPIRVIGARFHNALAQLAVAIARHGGCNQVIMSGGCFQNALLTQQVRCRLLEAGFSVIMHRHVPPGDGGIALGQIFVAAKLSQGSFHVPGNSR